MDVLKRNNVRLGRPGLRPLVFAHGFGCDQQMWRFVAPAFQDTHRVVLFDHLGCGGSDLSAYSELRHARIDGYAQDLAEILDTADLRDAVIVGHSVSAMIAMLASFIVPQRVSALVMVGPSPRYLNDPPGYIGGFERADVDTMIEMVESNMLGWASFLAPVVMGPDSPAALTDELKASFCAIDPYITRRFAAATFLGDNRADLPRVRVPTLVVQVSEDAIASREVGEYVCRHVPGAQLAVIDGTGHCPHMTHPQETIALIRDFVGVH